MSRLWRINLLVAADDDATQQDVESLVHDLEWVGGCRDPENDPMFHSVEIIEGEVWPARQRKVKP